MRTEEEFYTGLIHGGKWLFRHKLIFHDKILDEIDFSWNYWHIVDKIICKFKGHIPEQYYRLPKEGEEGLTDKMGCVFDAVRCKRCWKTLEVLSK